MIVSIIFSRWNAIIYHTDIIICIKIIDIWWWWAHVSNIDSCAILMLSFWWWYNNTLSISIYINIFIYILTISRTIRSNGSIRTDTTLWISPPFFIFTIIIAIISLKINITNIHSFTSYNIICLSLLYLMMDWLNIRKIIIIYWWKCFVIISTHCKCMGLMIRRRDALGFTVTIWAVVGAGSIGIERENSG